MPRFCHENLYRSYREKQGDIDRQIHQILVNLDDKQRRALRRAIAYLDRILPAGTDREVELAMCEVANVLTLDCRAFLGTLRPRRGRYGRLAYSFLGENQEAMVWRFVAAYKRWFPIDTRAARMSTEHLGTTEVTEVVKDLDATLDAEQEEEIPGAIAYAINKVGEAIARWMPHLLSRVVRDWEEWEASVWKAVSKFKRQWKWAT